MRNTGSQRRVADDERTVDQAVLTLLLDDLVAWSFEDLVREIGSRTDTEDAVTRLRASGLVAGAEQLVVATRAARRAAQLLAA